ncbi:hypothetical protein NIES4074_62960 (plasmid) [Cylindrospermum sp. NIES-4074]|jgi:hypothetical protein|nr:hypothetical protein NIES4074_62960 [Cylindrospermum sp. NIES-4074]
MPAYTNAPVIFRGLNQLERPYLHKKTAIALVDLMTPTNGYAEAKLMYIYI